MKDFISVDELAKLAEVTPAAIYDKIKNKKLLATKKPIFRYRIAKKDAEAYILSVDKNRKKAKQR